MAANIICNAVSPYTLVSFAHNGGSAKPGSNVCWTATVSPAVIGSALTVTTSDGKAINIAVGATSGQYCEVVGCAAINRSVVPGGAGNPILSGATAAANLAAPASYTLTSVTRSPTSINVGQTVTFTGTLNTAVVGPARTVVINPGSGANKTLTFATGATTATVTHTYAAAGSFTPTVASHGACVTGSPAIGSVTVAGPAIIDISSPPGEVDPGDQICYTVTSNFAALAGGLAFNVTVSGNAAPGGNVCGSYNGTTSGPVITTIPGTIPAGSTTATVCYTVPGA